MKWFHNWLDDTLHQRLIKAIICAFPYTFTFFTSTVSFVTVFLGDYSSKDFPKAIFWYLTIAASIGAWIFFTHRTLNNKYADPFMTQCIMDEHGSVYYYFKNRTAMKENTAVEIKQIKKGRTIPYAIGYIDQQDPIKKDEMLVRPIAFHRDNKYQQDKPTLISRKHTSRFMICDGALNKDVLLKAIDCEERGANCA